MKRIVIFVIFFGMVPVAMASESPGKGNSLVERAGRVIKDGDEAGAIPILELALRNNCDKVTPLFEQAHGMYWHLVANGEEFVRAYLFFSQLARLCPKNMEVLASEANAIGGYIGWLFEEELTSAIEQDLVVALDQRARRNYAGVLTVEPNNFSALLGFAIYELHSPGGKPRAKKLFDRLNRLRNTYPEHPWFIVDEWEKRLK